MRTSSTRPLSISKLKTSEDENVQHELALLAEADVIAREMIIEGAIPRTSEGWVRLDQALDTRAGSIEDDGARSVTTQRGEWAYRIGVAVGLRLARLDSPAL